MEIRASYMVVGCFCLAVILGIFGFTLWIAKQSSHQATHLYDITITESVTGLNVNSDVLFNGIRVGSVKDLSISTKVPGAIRARVSIDARTPIRKDSTATLSFKGVTGVTLITLSGGTADSPLVELDSDEIGQIQYSPSAVSSLLANMPNTVEMTNSILLQLKDLLSGENEAEIKKTISSLATISSTLAAESQSIASFINNMETTSRNLVRTTASAEKTINQINGMLNSAQPGIHHLSTDGLNNLRLLLHESRTLVQSLNRLSNKLENDPRQFFFGNTIQEVEIK